MPESAPTTRSSASVTAAPAPAGERFGGFRVSDLWAGVAAAAVLLPQSMAFGVALLVPHGFGAATGALAGLIAAAALSTVSGAVGGTLGLISAPTGPTLILVSGALSALAGAGLAGGGLLAGLAAVLITAGLLEALAGLAGGGRLIKFIPYPVMSGFMTGAGLLMVLSQIDPISGMGAAESWAAWRWLPAVAAAVTFACMSYGPRLLPAIPGTIAGLAGGTLAFHLMALAAPRPLPARWLIGSLPGPGAIRLPLAVDALGHLPWFPVLTSALALAVLASLNTMLTSVVADEGTGARHDARRALLGQGGGLALAGVLGGVAGSATTGATLVAVRSGGRRWCGVSTGLIFVILVLAGGPIGSILPVSVLAGIIVHLAVHMLEWDIFLWLRRRRTRMDAGIALLVTTVTVAYDLMTAVGVGVAVAVVLFIRSQIRAPVVHRRSTAADMHSVRSRSARERELLDTHGNRIVLYELRGNLFFATAEGLYEEVAPDLDRPVWLILHLRRVGQVDLTATRILRQMAQRLQAHGGEIVFCDVHKAIGLGRKVRKALRKVSPSQGAPEVKTFNGADEALEYAEDALLDSLGCAPAAPTGTVPLAEADLCLGMQPEEVAALEAVMREHNVAPDELVFRAGEHGSALYVVRAGEIDMRLPTSTHHYKRLANYRPGRSFGEIAFMEPGPRTADAVALRPSELLVLDRAAFDTLRRDHPATAIAVLMALGHMQGQHLRWSAREIRRLAEW